MPRHFTGASSESITFSAGNLAALDGGPQTIAAIWYPDTTTTHSLMVALNGSNSGVWNWNPYSDGHLYYTVEGAFKDSPASCDYVATEWQLSAVSKADGISAPRFHRYRYASQTWAHADNTSIGDATNGPVASFKLGALTGSDWLNGDLAIAAVWSRVLSDGELEALPNTLAAWQASTPAALWALNQSSTAQSVLDLSGGGADQTAISGTTVSSNQVPGFSYGGEVWSNLRRPPMWRGSRAGRG